MVVVEVFLIFLFGNLVASESLTCLMKCGDRVTNLMQYNNTCSRNKYFKNHSNLLLAIMKFSKQKHQNHFHPLVNLNISISNTETESYFIKIDTGKKNWTKLIDFVNIPEYDTESPAQIQFSKSEEGKAAFLQLSQLRTGINAFYCMKIPFSEQIDSPLQWTPSIFIEFTFWVDQTVFVIFNSAPEKFQVTNYIIRIITSDYTIFHEKFLSPSTNEPINKIDFNLLQFGIDYFVVVETICGKCLDCCIRGESDLFRLPVTETERVEFSNIHTIILSAFACVLFIVFTIALILGERKRIKKSKRIVLILPRSTDLYRTTAFINLLQNYKFDLVTDQWTTATDTELELRNVILNCKYVITVWAKINSSKAIEDVGITTEQNLDVSNVEINTLLTLVRTKSNPSTKKLINVLWEPVQLQEIPTEFQPFTSFWFPNDVQKLLGLLSGRKIGIEETREFYEVCKIQNSEDFSENYSADDNRIIYLDNDCDNGNTYHEYNSDASSRKIFLPVFHEDSGLGLESSCSSVLLHQNRY